MVVKYLRKQVDVLTPKILAVQNHDPFVDIQIHSNEYHLRSK